MSAAGRAGERTLERARALGREIKAALEGRGFRVGTTVRTWADDYVPELKALPRDSAILGVTVHEGGTAAEAAALITADEAPVVFVGDHVVVCEVKCEGDEVGGAGA